ncbi:cohesin domain-containing protein [Paenibacillus sp.]|uniref:cohesin domain-containing protein n=1 Tax=Paenibacillus sp. TaxID=58172 RepID=UPI0028113C78|nr:cohesin domain-containing protein [Paenibacillus sp.]
MKSWFLLLVAISMVALPAATAVAAESTAAVSITAAAQQQTVGKAFDVHISISEAANLAGISFRLRYDPAKLQLAKKTNGDPMVQFASGFQSFGGSTVNETTGTLAYPLLYDKPLVAASVNSRVMTATFIPLTSERVQVQLEQISVTNYVSSSIQKNTQASASVWVGPVLPKSPDETKFSIKSALSLIRGAGGALIDFNGDGTADKSDMVYVLQQVEPRAFN